MAAIIIQGKKFTYTIKRKSIRSIRIRLNSSDSFTVSCPNITPSLVVTGFIDAHSSWIYRNSLKITGKTDLHDLTQLCILGQPYQLFITQTHKDTVVINPSSRKVYLYSSRLTDSHLKKLLEIHLRPLALTLISRELEKLSQQFGFKYSRVTIRNQKTRFGSCSSMGNLSFNWQIIFFPQDKFQHILLHELTHLEIKNHSHKFWDQLTCYDPDCKTNNTWLRKEGSRHFLL